jgi:hypothetical protein
MKGIHTDEIEDWQSNKVFAKYPRTVVDKKATVFAIASA